MQMKLTKEIRVIRIIQLTITDKNFINSHKRSPNAFTRNRKLSFGTIVSTILQLAKRSLQIECNLLGDRTMSEPVSKQAFSEARYKISHTGFKALNDLLLKEAYIDDTEGLWNGFRVFGTDGSVIRLPESEEAAEYFGRHNSSGFNNGKDPILARISEVVELTTGIVVNADIAPGKIAERPLAEAQINDVTAFFRDLNQNKLLYVFDRGYVSRRFIRILLDLGVDFMFRVPRKFNNQVDALAAEGECDTLVEIAPDIPPLRLTVRDLPSDEQCVLLSSLSDLTEITADSLFSLYWLRWTGCEEGYKRQKIALELENFSGKGVEAILQEFWATVVTVNIFQVHCLVEEGPLEMDNPPETRINRSVVYGSLREALFQTIMGDLSAQEFKDKFTKVARRCQLKVRPGRHYSRDGVKKRKEKHVFRRVC